MTQGLDSVLAFTCPKLCQAPLLWVPHGQGLALGLYSIPGHPGCVSVGVRVGRDGRGHTATFYSSLPLLGFPNRGGCSSPGGLRPSLTHSSSALTYDLALHRPHLPKHSQVSPRPPNVKNRCAPSSCHTHTCTPQYI